MSNYLDDAWTAYGANGGNTNYGTTANTGTDLTGGSSGWGTILGSILGSGSGGNGNQSSNSGSIFSSPTWSDLLKGAQLGYSIIQSKTPPKFENVPASPDQQKLNDLYFKYMTDPATSNNRAIVSGYARDALNSMHPTWTPPATSTGLTGYNGTANRQFSNIPPFDWSSYLGGGKPAGASAQPTNPSTPSVAVGGSGDNGPATGMFAPTGTSGDPFNFMNNMPSSNPSSVDMSSAVDLIKQYGKPAAEFIGGVMTGNIVLTGKSLIDGFKAWQSNPQQQQLPTKQPTTDKGNPITPGMLTPSGPGDPSIGLPPRTNLDPGFGPEEAANWAAWNNLWLQYGGSPMTGASGSGIWDDSGPNHAPSGGRRG